MNQEIWSSFASSCDTEINKTAVIKQFQESTTFNNKDLNVLWMAIRDSIMKAARDVIPNH